jgi:IS30 family transposase
MVKAAQERREKVAHLIRKRIPETIIAKELGVSRQTIVRDVAFLKNSAQSWLDELAKGEFIFEYQMTLEKIKNNGTRLESFLDEIKDPRQRLYIIKEIDRNAKIYLELLGETPTIHAYRKAIQKVMAEKCLTS